MDINIQYGALYFYTSIIHNGHTLIHDHHFYSIITDSLSWLHHRNYIRVYGFVIMPNHIHLIWQLLKNNGKENPAASLKKFTAHTFEYYLRNHHPEELEKYAVDWRSRRYNFWSPKPHWLLLTKQETMMLQLNYLHNSPIQERWKLSKDPAEYVYSSARFYGSGVRNFDFLCHYEDFTGE